MTDLQKIYDGCKKIYNNCYDMIEGMSFDTKRYLDSQGTTDYNPEEILIKFDIILQYSLLQIATADYEIDRNELIFIRDLTEKGDLVNYLNSLGGTPISWDTIYHADVLEIRKFLESLKKRIADLSQEFIFVFTTCDLDTPQHDYLSDLTADVLCIIDGLASMDGKIERSEEMADCFVLHVLKVIEKLKKSKK